MHYVLLPFKLLYNCRWDTDLRVRNTVWTMLIGHTVSYVCVFGTNQMILQRVLAVKTVQSARQ